MVIKQKGIKIKVVIIKENIIFQGLFNKIFLMEIKVTFLRVSYSFSYFLQILYTFVNFSYFPFNLTLNISIKLILVLETNSFYRFFKFKLLTFLT